MAKKEYTVFIPITGIVRVPVEAKNEEDAIEAAFESKEFSLDNIKEWGGHRRFALVADGDPRTGLLSTQ